MGKWLNTPVAGAVGSAVGEMKEAGSKEGDHGSFFRKVRTPIGGRDIEKNESQQGKPPTTKKEIESGFFKRIRTPIG